MSFFCGCWDGALEIDCSAGDVTGLDIGGYSFVRVYIGGLIDAKGE